LHNPGYFGEESIVSAYADIHAGFEFRAALADENRTARDKLTGKALDSEPLGVTIAAVS
jgi:hypothetical protein